MRTSITLVQPTRFTSAENKVQDRRVVASLHNPLPGNLAVLAAGFSALPEVLVQKAAHMTGYHVSIFFQREVAGVEQVELQILEVSLVRMRTFSGKKMET